MAVVRIDLDAMQALVEALDRVIVLAPQDVAHVKKRLEEVLLSYPSANRWLEGGDTIWRLRQIVGDCRQRLGLARLIAASTPGIGPVLTMDDVYAELLPEDYTYQEPPQDMIDMLTEKLTVADQAAGGELSDINDPTRETRMSPDRIHEIAVTIARMVVNAPEPYKTLFLENLPDLQFVDKTGTGAHDNFVTNKIHIDLDGFLTDVPTACHTFFHEYGHHIDDKERSLGSRTSSFEFTTGGQTYGLGGWLEVDTAAGLAQAIDDLGLTNDPDQAQRVTNAVTQWRTAFLPGWIPDNTTGLHTDATVPGSDAEVFVGLRNYYMSDIALGNTTARTASDIMGAETNHGIQPWYGHHEWGYWAAPEVTGSPAKEFWAGFFGDTMVYYSQLAELAAPEMVPGVAPSPTVFGKTSLDATRSVFPTASDAAQAMAEEMRS